MHVIVLGGCNDENEILDEYTKERCDKAIYIINNNSNIILHLSGGIDKHFNKSNTNHSEICKKYILDNINTHINNIILHSKNNSTVDEAINFGKYFQNTNDNIIIISNIWHIDRVKYLFNKTFKFYNISNYEFISTENNNLELKKENDFKIQQLINKPYGIWKEWLKTNYYEKFVNLKLVQPNEHDGVIIIKMRNENNKFFFNSNKFYWDTFKDIFYHKYFSNEIPPYFITFDNEIIGFIGCKTIQKNINDIGIMMFKKYQSKGLGKVSLKKFIKIFNEKYNINKNKIIVSQILKSNIGSYKIFIDNDFIIDKDKTNENNYYLIYYSNKSQDNGVA
jgi:RimJ/RimL family protein N-acetyltransferase